MLLSQSRELLSLQRLGYLLSLQPETEGMGREYKIKSQKDRDKGKERKKKKSNLYSLLLGNKFKK